MNYEKVAKKYLGEIVGGKNGLGMGQIISDETK